MAKYILTHWESIELLANVVSKADGINIEEFYKGDFLDSQLGKYSHEHHCLELTKRIEKVAGRFGSRDIYNLGQNIRENIPTILSSNSFNNFRNYLGEAFTLKGKMPQNEWKRDLKIEQFYPSKWNIYYYDEKLGHDTIVQHHPVICVGILTLEPFGKASILICNLDQEIEETYTGEYTLIMENLLHLSMRTKESGQKMLEISFSIGSDSHVPLAIGIYTNVNRQLYAGTLLIKRLADNDIPTTVGIYKIDENNGGLRELKETMPVDPYITAYLLDKRRYPLDIPKSITNKTALLRWLNSENSAV
ncbi:hypothetical protein [Sphingobacterium siyangense]|uniref:hypothetical protein n=1 Tax=Sphingobacterium siyangense TaxID=459529 RepID=UPI003DA4561A